jgi:hypothetical protein
MASTDTLAVGVGETVAERVVESEGELLALSVALSEALRVALGEADSDRDAAGETDGEMVALGVWLGVGVCPIQLLPLAKKYDVGVPIQQEDRGAQAAVPPPPVLGQ